MKRNHLILVVSFLFNFSFAQDNSVLTGKIINPNNQTVYLQGFKAGEKGRPQQIMLDSTKLDSKNHFVLRTHVDSTTHVTFFDGKEYAQVLLSPGDSVHLTLHTSLFDETLTYYGEGAEKNNIVASLALIGESNTAEVNNLIKLDINDSTAIFSKHEELSTAYIDLVESYQNVYPEFKQYGDQLIQQKQMSVKMLKRYVRRTIEFEKQMQKILNKKAIDFTGIDLDGKKTSLSDYKGKMIVVDFWATWCGPCKAEFPAYKELEEKYGEEIHFVSVGVYCKEDEWKEMASDEGFKNNIFLSKEDAEQIKEYSVRTIPRYLVINKDFKLIDADAPRPSSGKLQEYWLE